MNTFLPVFFVGAILCLILAVIEERSRKDQQKYLALLEIYKSNGGKCYVVLRANASDEDRIAWERQEKINKRALELAGLTSLRAGSYVYFK